MLASRPISLSDFLSLSPHILTTCPSFWSAPLLTFNSRSSDLYWLQQWDSRLLFLLSLFVLTCVCTLYSAQPLTHSFPFLLLLFPAISLKFVFLLFDSSTALLLFWILDYFVSAFRSTSQTVSTSFEVAYSNWLLLSSGRLLRWT